ncbi:peptidase [Hyphomonas sp. CACIAM 19H1]|uniref:S41 family peptidase n=1 Tax=Hyphomonas sp. CACIAM 19H1 TaxID=1873716 RepID=UPI000DED7175|nr:S41 family peptidase [Hyphomonas sp. CACIAM 19H1]AXE63833.1 peptidase [Hyphomonas sp. CACIAM 19H1]
MRNRLTKAGSMKALALALLTLGMPVWLSACGGGGGGSSGGGAASPPPPPPPVAGPTWTQGVYQPASTFKNRCEVRRVGRDIEGNTYPDVQGTALEERFWLRSWTNETYLWNTEVTDRNPANFTNRLDYFAVLRTFATTPSGKEKDDFHFSEPTEEYLAARNAAPTATYGASYIAFSTTPPRDFRIRYTEPNSPASTMVSGQPNFERGSRILRINGIDLVSTNSPSDINQLNAALFPSTPGLTNSFTVEDPDGATRTVSLTSVNLSSKPVNRTRIISTPTGNVGYILFNTFSPYASERDIYDAMAAMQTAGVSDLVLDLRYNGGGLLAVASQLSYMIAGETRTRNQVFEQLRFNAAAGNRNPVTGAVNNPIPFYSTGVGFTVPDGTPLPSLNLPRVFVLSTGSTCSASEAVVNGLRGIGVEVILIGNTTCGKPFGFYPTDNCGETYYTIQFQGVNGQGFGDYADGFIPSNSAASFGVRLPGCQVSDDLSRELGDENERLLAAALSYRGSLACPAVSAQATTAVASANGSAGSGGIPLRPPSPSTLETNRDMTMPHGR